MCAKIIAKDACEFNKLTNPERVLKYRPEVKVRERHLDEHYIVAEMPEAMQSEFQMLNFTVVPLPETAATAA